MCQAVTPTETSERLTPPEPPRSAVGARPDPASRLADATGWIVLGAVVATGTIVRFWNLGHHSLWLDEAWLALSLDRSGLQDVVFRGPNGGCNPTPYLLSLAIHAFIRLFGNSEATLRFIPALFSAASIPAIYLLCRRIRPDRYSGLLAAIIMAFNAQAIFYAKELKQYAGDALWILIAYLACEAYLARGGAKRIILLVVALVVGLAFSHTTLIAAASVVLLVLWRACRPDAQASSQAPRGIRRRILEAVIATMAVGAGYGVTYVMVLRHQSSPRLVNFWHHSFPAAPTPLAAWDHFAVQLPRFFDWFFGDMRLWAVGLMVVGLSALWTADRRRTICYWMLPWAATLILSMFRKYPFGAGRIDFFFLPLCIVPIACGAISVCQWIVGGARRALSRAWPGHSSNAAWATRCALRIPLTLAPAVLLLIVATALAVPRLVKEARDPKWRQELRPLIQRYLREAEPQDLTLILDGRTRYAFDYYVRSSPHDAHVLRGPLTPDDVVRWIEGKARSGQQIWLPNVRSSDQQIDPVLDAILWRWPDARWYREPGADLVAFKFGPSVSPMSLGGLTFRPFSNEADRDRSHDARLGTRWTSQRPREPGQSVTIDFGSPQAVGLLVLDATLSPGDWPRSLEALWSLNGRDWSSEGIAVACGPRTTLTFAPPCERVRYLRLVAKDGSKNWWSIHEIRAFAAPG